MLYRTMSISATLLGQALCSLGYSGLKLYEFGCDVSKFMFRRQPSISCLSLARLALAESLSSGATFAIYYYL